MIVTRLTRPAGLLLVIAPAVAGLAAPAAAAPKAAPIPKGAIEPGPRALLASVPALAEIPRAEDCELQALRRTIGREAEAARAREQADYGVLEPPTGASMPAWKRVLDHAATLEGDCLDVLDMEAVMRRTVDPELEGLRADLKTIAEEFRSGFAACPAAPEGGKSPACTRSLYARANVRGLGVVNRRLKVADAEFAEAVRRAGACLETRERLVQDGLAAGIAGAGVSTVLAPLTRAWAVPPLVAQRYTTICRSVQEAMQTDIPKPH